MRQHGKDRVEMHGRALTRHYHGINGPYGATLPGKPFRQIVHGLGARALGDSHEQEIGPNHQYVTPLDSCLRVLRLHIRQAVERKLVKPQGRGRAVGAHDFRVRAVYVAHEERFALAGGIFHVPHHQAVIHHSARIAHEHQVWYGSQAVGHARQERGKMGAPGRVQLPFYEPMRERKRIFGA